MIDYQLKVTNYNASLLHNTIEIQTLSKPPSFYGRPSPPKIQGCQIDQQIQSWFKDQLQDRIANKGMA